MINRYNIQIRCGPHLSSSPPAFCMQMPQGSWSIAQPRGAVATGGFFSILSFFPAGSTVEMTKHEETTIPDQKEKHRQLLKTILIETEKQRNMGLIQLNWFNPQRYFNWKTLQPRKMPLISDWVLYTLIVCESIYFSTRWPPWPSFVRHRSRTSHRASTSASGRHGPQSRFDMTMICWAPENLTALEALEICWSFRVAPKTQNKTCGGATLQRHANMSKPHSVRSFNIAIENGHRNNEWIFPLIACWFSIAMLV